MSLTPDAVLADPALSARYRVVETTAPGAEDALYLARRLDTGALVDLRVLAGDLGGDRVLVAALVQHATLLARVAAQCPGIAAFHECERTAGGLVVSMAHPEGPTLREVIKREGTLGLHRAVRLAAGLARALERVHDLGLVHGGLRPDNVVLTGPDEDVTLTHFGLDWVLLSRLPEAGSRQGAPPGDLAYRAPEQAWDQATPRSDIYAVGAILYEMLAGAPPPAPLPSQPRVHAEPLRDCRADVSPALERIVTQALQVAPERRPTDLAVVLERLMAEQDPDRQPEPPQDRGARDGATRAGTTRWLAWSGVAVAAAIAIWFAHARVTSAVRPRPPLQAAPAAVAPGPPIQEPSSPIDQALAPPAPPDAPGPGIAERPADAKPAARTTAAPPAAADPAQRAERPPGTDVAAKRQIASSPPSAAPASPQVAEPARSAAGPATRPDSVAATTATRALTATEQPGTGENDPGAIIDWLLNESPGRER